MSNMRLKNYMNNIAFRNLNPNVPTDQNWMHSHIDYHNTILPVDDESTRSALSRISHIPRMSTFAIAFIINLCVAQLPID